MSIHKRFFIIYLMIHSLFIVGAEQDWGPGFDELEEAAVEPGHPELDAGQLLHDLQRNIMQLQHNGLSADQFSVLKGLQEQMNNLIEHHESPGRKCTRAINGCLEDCLPGCASPRTKKLRSRSLDGAYSPSVSSRSQPPQPLPFLDQHPRSGSQLLRLSSSRWSAKRPGNAEQKDT